MKPLFVQRSLKPNISILIPFGLALLVIVLCQCKKKESYRIKPETLEYCNFQPGSFWVYKDQLGQIDTVRILRQSSSISTGYLNYEAEYIDMFLNSMGTDRYQIMTRKDIDVLDYSSSITYHSLPVGNKYLGVTFLERLDSLDNFKGDIKHFYLEGVSGTTEINDEYWLKNVGVIKRVLKNGLIKNLIAHQVIQK